MFEGRKILIGITGSIAAYKSILLLRQLKAAGAEVKIIMTPAAKDFVGALTLETLSGNKVLSEISSENEWANHVMLGRWADLFIIYPASCNTIAKMANGVCDNLLLAVYLSATCQVWVAPAMDEDMWLHASTRRNIGSLEAVGNRVLDVGTGPLASGLSGAGRLAEPDEVFGLMQDAFKNNGTWVGRKAVVTAGPTYEAIDPVRFIGNHSSGKMGWELARALKEQGADTTLVLGPSNLPDIAGVVMKRVTSAREMLEEVMHIFPEADIAIMAAAVADFRPLNVADEKIKKANAGLVIELTENPDILKTCGQNKRPGQLLVGFALETNNERENAFKKLESKNADFIVLNSLKDKGAGFKTETNKVTLIGKQSFTREYALMEKAKLADELIAYFSEIK